MAEGNQASDFYFQTFQLFVLFRVRTGSDRSKTAVTSLTNVMKNYTEPMINLCEFFDTEEEALPPAAKSIADSRSTTRRVG